MSIKLKFLGIMLVAAALATAQSPNHSRPTASRQSDSDAPARLIDFTQVLKGPDGNPIRSSSDPASSPLTLSVVAINALDGVLQGDQSMSGDVKFRLDALARKVYLNKAAVLTNKELADLEERIGKAYSGAVVGAAFRILDPALVDKP